MDQSTIKKVNQLSLFGYLALFPFGQLPAFLLGLMTGSMRAYHPSDFLMGIFVMSSFLLLKTEKWLVLRSTLGKVIAIASFGFLVNAAVGYFSLSAFLYFLRLLVYLLAGYFIFKLKRFKSNEVISFLVLIGASIAAAGLIQYFLLPDTKSLKIFGWDDHYYRLIGTFFDPTYTGILLVLTALLVLLKLRNGLIKYALLALSFSSILFTYSRASYLALLVGLFIIVVSRSKSLLRFILFIVAFLGFLYLLPRPASEGVKLERTFSIFLRINNYRETIQVWGKSPVFGVGYNNMCQARQDMLQSSSTTLVTHSCAGSDNSFLLILATMGITGALIMVYGVSRLHWYIPSSERIAIHTLLASVTVHSFFSNTLFYPWVMGWFALYLGVHLKSSKVTKNT